MPLYLVPTPIGNLDDITLRAIETLKSADVIAAEDTRVTKRLLERHGISARMDSLHEHNERAKAPRLAEVAASGRVALVTNAGTPCVSDPGYRLVNECIARGIEVVALPGASAVTTALVGSGLPTHRFSFLGFLPRKPGARIKELAAAGAVDGSFVFFESPNRLARTLAEAAEVLGGERRACIARELTKVHEELLRGTLGELVERLAERPPRGECTVVVEGATRSAPPPAECDPEI